MNQSKSTGTQNKQSAKEADTKASDTTVKSEQRAKDAVTRTKPGMGKSAAKKQARQP